VKHLHAILLLALGLVAAGVFPGAVIAETMTTPTAPFITTAPTVATTVPSKIPAGVRVAGVRVGGLAPGDAVAVVRTAFARPLAVVVDGNKLELDPTRFASASIPTAVARARAATRGTNVKLVVAVHGAPVRAWVAAVRKRFARTAIDARLTLRNGAPLITRDRSGRSLDATLLTQRVVAALRGNTRLPVGVHTRMVAPQLSADAFANVIVINREINRLFLYDAGKLWRTFPVATGQAIYPTPRGEWHIVVKYRNPWWYPPTQDDWARGLKPVPPGPDNPLGTRWMGLDAPGVGIHGTDAPASIGYSASHGCVRMQVPDAEWLYDQVDIGTTVFVV
jgi:lipoprotein-anchoring transpeptidase ErfK/SrfK